MVKDEFCTILEAPEIIYESLDASYFSVQSESVESVRQPSYSCNSFSASLEVMNGTTDQLLGKIEDKKRILLHKDKKNVKKKRRKKNVKKKRRKKNKQKKEERKIHNSNFSQVDQWKIKRHTQTQDPQDFSMMKIQLWMIWKKKPKEAMFSHPTESSGNFF